MKALLAIFAIAAGAALVASAPASAKPVSKSDLRCLVLDSGRYSARVVNVCDCQTISNSNVPADIRQLLKPDASRISLNCPSGGGGLPPYRTADNPPPDDNGHKGRSWSFSKGSSKSDFVGAAIGCSGGGTTMAARTTSLTGSGGCGGFAGIFAGQQNKSVTVGTGGAAGAEAGSGGGAYTGSFGGYNTSSTSGGTGGSSCAGSACGGGSGPL
jgi:hypothetical protein